MKRDRWILLAVLLLLAAASVFASTRFPWVESTKTTMALDGVHGATDTLWGLITPDDDATIYFDGSRVHTLRLYAYAWDCDSAELTVYAGERSWSFTLTSEPAWYEVTVDSWLEHMNADITDEGQAVIEEAQADHGPGVHRPMLSYLWTCSWCAALLLYLLTRRAPRLDLACLTAVLCGGLMIVLTKPIINPYSWDEGQHRVLTVTLAGLHQGDAGFAGYLAGLNVWDAGYAPSSLGVLLGRVLGRFQGVQLYRCGLIAQVIFHAAASALAVRIAPRYKLTFAAAAMIPTLLFLSASFTYDVVVFDGILLGTALWLEEMESPERLLTAGRAMLLAGCFCLGTLAKVAYAPLILLLMMLPAGKFASRGRKWLFRGFVVLLMISEMISLLLPGPYDELMAGDKRFKGTDTAAQLASMAADPGAVLSMLGRYTLRRMAAFYGEGMCNWAYVTDNFPWGKTLLGVLVLLCPLCTLGEDGRQGVLTFSRRWKLFLLALAPMLILTVTQYVVSSEVGSYVIRGMQSRYAVPVEILLALSLALPEKWRRACRKGGPWIAGIIVLLMVGTVFVMGYKEFLVGCWKI